MSTTFLGVKMTPTELAILDWLVQMGQHRSRSEAIRTAVQAQAMLYGLRDTEESAARDERRDHPPKRRSRTPSGQYVGQRHDRD